MAPDAEPQRARRATATERSLQGQVAAHTSWAQTSDRSARTAPARKAFRDRFEDQVDPERKLAPDERARRAAHARKAFYAGLALKSAQARRAKKAARDRAR